MNKKEYIYTNSNIIYIAFYRERERGHAELTFDGLVDEDDGYESRIIVNVVS